MCNNGFFQTEICLLDCWPHVIPAATIECDLQLARFISAKATDENVPTNFLMLPCYNCHLPTNNYPPTVYHIPSVPLTHFINARNHCFLISPQIEQDVSFAYNPRHTSLLTLLLGVDQELLHWSMLFHLAILLDVNVNFLEFFSNATEYIVLSTHLPYTTRLSLTIFISHRSRSKDRTMLYLSSNPEQPIHLNKLTARISHASLSSHPPGIINVEECVNRPVLPTNKLFRTGKTRRGTSIKTYVNWKKLDHFNWINIKLVRNFF